MTGVKRSPANHNTSKISNSKRSYLSESQSSITHTGSPVNPMTAKALASKLNERNNLLNGSKKSQSTSNNGAVNDIPIPPLISIQTSSANNRFKDGTDSQYKGSTVHRNKYSYTKKKTGSDIHCKSFDNGKYEKNEISNKQHNGTSSLHHSKSVSTFLKKILVSKMYSLNYMYFNLPIFFQSLINQLSLTKMHKCDFCSKKFNKVIYFKKN